MNLVEKRFPYYMEKEIENIYALMQNGVPIILTIPLLEKTNKIDRYIKIKATLNAGAVKMLLQNSYSSITLTDKNVFVNEDELPFLQAVLRDNAISFIRETRFKEYTLKVDEKGNVALLRNGIKVGLIAQDISFFEVNAVLDGCIRELNACFNLEEADALVADVCEL